MKVRPALSRDETPLGNVRLTAKVESETLDAVTYAILIVVALVLVALLLAVQRRRI